MKQILVEDELKYVQDEEEIVESQAGPTRHHSQHFGMTCPRPSRKLSGC
jgi:hypothetical protein